MTAHRRAGAAAGLFAAALGVALVSGAVEPLVRGVVAVTSAGSDDTSGRTQQVAVWRDVGWSSRWPSVPTSGRSIEPRRPSPPARATEPAPPDGTPVEPERFPGWFGARPAPMAVTLAPMESCPQPHGPAVHTLVAAEALGGGRARVSWWSLGDSDVATFQVRAVPVLTSSTAADTARTAQVAAGGGCRTVTTTVNGLTPGISYEFWLETLSRSAASGGAERAHTRGRSQRVLAR